MVQNSPPSFCFSEYMKRFPLGILERSLTPPTKLQFPGFFWGEETSIKLTEGCDLDLSSSAMKRCSISIAIRVPS